MAIWGPLNETFRAKFIFFREEHGEAEALKRAQSVLVFTNLVTIIIVTIIIAFPQPLARIIAPTLKGAQFELLLFMIRIIAPSFLFNQLTQIFISILNAYQSIYIPEISGFISGIINLVLIITLAPLTGIYSLIYGYYAGLLLLGLLLVIQLQKLKLGLFKQLGQARLSEVKPFLLFALPFFFPYFAGQIAQVVEKSLSSAMGTGVVSIVDYSRKFSDILLNVLSSVLTTIMVPALSLKFAQKDTSGFFAEFKQSYQLGFLLMTLATAMFTACPDAFVAILYRQGSIDHGALSEISTLAMLYSWSAVAIFLYIIIGMALVSSKNGKIYAFYGVTAQLIMVAVNLLMFRTAGVYVFPLSLLFSHIIAAIFMFGKLPTGKRILVKTTFSYLFLMVSNITILYLVNKYAAMPDHPILKIAANGALLLSLLLILIFALKLDERLIVVRIYNKIARNNQE